MTSQVDAAVAASGPPGWIHGRVLSLALGRLRASGFPAVTSSAAANRSGLRERPLSGTRANGSRSGRADPIDSNRAGNRARTAAVGTGLELGDDGDPLI